MSEKTPFVLGTEIGTGRSRRRSPRFPRALGDARPIRTIKPDEVLPPGGMSDIPNRMLEVASLPVLSRTAELQDQRYQKPISMGMMKAQMPDVDSSTIDSMVQNGTNVPAGTTVNILTVSIASSVRAKIARFGWYTNAGALTLVDFGLYVGDDLYLPGGLLLGGTPQPLSQYNPSNGSIDYESLTECSINVNPNTDVSIRATNRDVNDHLCFGRLWGWAWPEDIRETGKRAYYDAKVDAIK